MAEIAIEEKPSHKGLWVVVGLLLVLLAAGAVWYFALGAPGLSDADRDVGAEVAPAPGTPAPAPGTPPAPERRP